MSKLIHLLVSLSFFTMAACSVDNPFENEKKPGQKPLPSAVDARASLTSELYVRNFSELPLNASLPEQPWTDSYWPHADGGIAYRWNESSGVSSDDRRAYTLASYEDLKRKDLARLSPAEKLDLYRGRYDYPATRSERARTQVLKTVRSHELFDPNFKIAAWNGLCHAWAMASLNFKEPGTVTLRSPQGLVIPFGSSDIKALLMYAVDQSLQAKKPSMLGGRCTNDFEALKKKRDSGAITSEEFAAQVKAGGCQDVDAGAFHIALANQIGILKEGFIADVTRDQEVWNQPVFAYRSTVISESSEISLTAQAGTVKEVTVLTAMFYGVETSRQWNAHPAERSRDKKQYSYRLQLNAEGDIIGGVWLTQDRPDFIWKQKPSETGSEEWETIMKIYQASVK